MNGPSGSRIGEFAKDQPFFTEMAHQTHGPERFVMLSPGLSETVCPACENELPQDFLQLAEQEIPGKRLGQERNARFQDPARG